MEEMIAWSRLILVILTISSHFSAAKRESLLRRMKKRENTPTSSVAEKQGLGAVHQEIVLAPSLFLKIICLVQGQESSYTGRKLQSGRSIG